jgi:ABC-type multidrug transport system permease subunit
VQISGHALAEVLLCVSLGPATMCSAGIAATAMIRDVDSATAALPLTAVVLSLISGIFVPIDQLPGWLEHIARIFPVYHLAAGLQTALGVAGDTALDAGNVAVLGLWRWVGSPSRRAGSAGSRRARRPKRRTPRRALSRTACPAAHAARRR